MNVFGYFGSNDLIQSSRNNDYIKVKYILQSGLNPNVQDTYGNTSLMVTTSFEVAELLLEHSANVDTQNNNGSTALMFAIKDYDISHMLLEECSDVNIQNNDGDTALTYAILNDDVKMVQLLINYGADVNLKSKDEYTPLMFAFKSGNPKIIEAMTGDRGPPLEIAIRNEYFDVVKMLVEAGNNDTKALMFASKSGRIDIARYLVDNGFDVNAEDVIGRTPLFYAAKAGEWELAEDVLIPNGANIDHQAKDGTTPLIIAATNGCYEMAKLLIEECANINAQDRYGGHTALNSALIFTNKKISLLLLSRDDIDISIKNNVNRTAFVYAEDLDVIKKFLSMGANIDEVDEYGDTLLIKAVKSKDIKTVEFLLENGANPKLKDKNGNDSLKIALKGSMIDGGYDGIVKLLTDDLSELKKMVKIRKWINKNTEIVKKYQEYIVKYTDSDYQINRILRQGYGWDEETELLMEKIYQALEEVPPAPFDMDIYRGISGYLSYDDLGVGDVVKLSGFTSFSLDFVIAKSFADDGFIIKTKLKKGEKALYFDLENETSYYEEREILTYPNLKVKVVGKYWDGNEQVLEVEIVYFGDKDIEKSIFRTPIAKEKELIFYDPQEDYVV